MHAARLSTSERLQRTLGVLCAARTAMPSRGWLSTRTLISRANICAVNSVIAELRENGVAVESKQSMAGDRPRWSYRVESVPAWWLGGAPGDMTPVRIGFHNE